MASPIIFFVCVCAAGELSTLLIQFEGTSSIQSLIAVSGALSELFICCFFGEMVCENLEGISETLFHSSGWYNFPTRLRRHLILVMQISQKPRPLNGLGLNSLSCRIRTMTKVNIASSQSLSQMKHFFSFIRRSSNCQLWLWSLTELSSKTKFILESIHLLRGRFGLNCHPEPTAFIEIHRKSIHQFQIKDESKRLFFSNRSNRVLLLYLLQIPSAAKQ